MAFSTSGGFERLDRGSTTRAPNEGKLQARAETNGRLTACPLAPSEGERARVRGFSRSPQWQIIRMRRTILQRLPDCRFHPFRFLQKSVIPNTHYPNSLGHKKGITLRVLKLLLRMPMATSIELDVQSRLRTVKIQNVIFDFVLSSELVSREASSTKPAPQRFLRPGGAFAESSGDRRKLHGRDCNEYSAAFQALTFNVNKQWRHV